MSAAIACGIGGTSMSINRSQSHQVTSRHEPDPITQRELEEYHRADAKFRRWRRIREERRDSLLARNLGGARVQPGAYTLQVWQGRSQPPTWSQIERLLDAKVVALLRKGIPFRMYRRLSVSRRRESG